MAIILIKSIDWFRLLTNSERIVFDTCSILNKSPPLLLLTTLPIIISYTLTIAIELYIKMAVTMFLRSISIV